jgi:LCP family protein required for cell wall assembly
MDNFVPHNKRRRTSLDGFSPAQPAKGKPGPEGSFHAFNQYYRPINPKDLNTPVKKANPSSSRALDNFGRIDGFRPNVQPPILEPKPQASVMSDVTTMDKGKPAKEKLSRKEKKRLKDQEKQRHGLLRRKKPKKIRKHPKTWLGMKVVGALAMVIILMVGGLGLKAYLKSRNIFKGGGNSAVLNNQQVDPTLLKGEGDGRVNILLLGKGGEGHDGPDLTDTLIIASIDPIAKEAALLSVPRDLWVQTPTGGQSKINAIYANAKYSVLNQYSVKQQTGEIQDKAEEAGIDAIESTLTDVLGIPIHYYSMIDFEGFREAIDTVGGVDINVKTQLYDPTVAWENNWNPLIAAVGEQHMDGKKALLYTRSRHGSARGDFDRSERQREVIVALKEKVLSLGTFSNPLKVSKLIDNFGNHVSTDFSLDEIMRVYDLAKGVAGDKIFSVGLADEPNNFVTTDTVNNQSIVRPKAGLFVYDDIQAYVRNELKDAFLKSENANVVILNGTETAGLATKESTELKSYGYTVGTVGDAPTKTYTKTVLVDLTKGTKKYTKSYLEKRLGVTATTKLPDTNINAGTADFVIILGSDKAGTSSNQ